MTLAGIIDTVLNHPLGIKEYPIFNVGISIDGWQGPFKYMGEFDSMHKKKQQAREFYSGRFMVMNTGRIARGGKTGLHTRKGTVHLDEPNPLPHVHYKDGGIDDISFKDGCAYIDNIHDIFCDAANSDKENAEMLEKALKPTYTLEGLYSTLPDQKMNTRITALEQQLKEKRDFAFQSIAKRKETRLKLLEHQYRRKISGQ